MSRCWHKNKTNTVWFGPLVSHISPSPWATGIAGGLFTLWLTSPWSLMSQDVKGCKFNIDFIKWFFSNMSVMISFNLEEAQPLIWICTQCGSPALRLSEWMLYLLEWQWFVKARTAPSPLSALSLQHLGPYIKLENISRSERRIIYWHVNRQKSL